MNLYALLYASTAREHLARDDIDDILRVAVPNNRALNITGLLIFNGEGFSQVLEGDRDVVRALYEKIERDPRHTGCIALAWRPIETRRFAEWGMGFRERTDLILGYDLD